MAQNEIVKLWFIMAFNVLTEHVTIIVGFRFRKRIEFDFKQFLIETTFGWQYYREDRRSCSELCICTSILSPPSCSVLTCLDSTRSLSCSQKQRDNKTLMYSHEDPSYQANRGRCMCYAGSFVCVKPSQGKGRWTSAAHSFLIRH